MKTTESNTTSSEGYEDQSTTSSVTSVDEKNNEATNVKKSPANKVPSVNNKKELKPRTPINKQHTTLRKTSPTNDDADKKKEPVLKKPGLKKPTLIKKSVDKEATPALTKHARVPRVALLTKKVVTPPSPAATEEKPKKAGSTRSLVSRLTAPTAASARRKEPATPASTVRKSEPIHKKVTSPPTSTPVKKAPTGRVSAVPSNKPVPATKTTPPAIKPTIRRITPPSSTATASKKVIKLYCLFFLPP